MIAGLRGDLGLTERGRQQAALLERRLAQRDLGADVLHVSTLPRALETGAYLARALGPPITRREDLHELRPGEADGLSIAGWQARADREVPPRDPYQAFSPGGESWATFLLRAETALLDLVTHHAGRTIVAVCHAGVIEASFYLAHGRGPSAPRLGLAPGNTSLTHWRHHPEVQGGQAWTLVTFNDTAHLDDQPET